MKNNYDTLLDKQEGWRGGGKIVDFVFENFKLDRAGIHGFEHWRAVYLNGLQIEELIPEVGVDLDVVRYFALLHDSQRVNDGADPDHGKRAAEFAEGLKDAGLLKHLPNTLSLKYALLRHSEGLLELVPESPTILTCWDADRLDLERIGIQVKPEMLCTDAARKILEERTKC